MRIISQSKTHSYNFDDICVLVKDNFVCTKKDAQLEILGTYETNERAMKVFDEMHKCYSTIHMLFQNIELSDEEAIEVLERWKTGAILVKDDEPKRLKTFDEDIFYMPEK